jgi:hypothetical protein
VMVLPSFLLDWSSADALPGLLHCEALPSVVPLKCSPKFGQVSKV